MRLAALLALLVAGCSVYTAPEPAYCDYPVITNACYSVCDAGHPTTICPIDDGTQWRITNEGTADRLVVSATEFYVVCTVSPRGELIYQRRRNEQGGFL